MGGLSVCLMPKLLYDSLCVVCVVCCGRDCKRFDAVIIVFNIR